MYIYPDNLKAKAVMWFWTLSDLVLIILALLISFILLFKVGFYVPIVLTAVYTFLSIQFDGASVKHFLIYATRFFITGRQYYTWGLEDELDEA